MLGAVLLAAWPHVALDVAVGDDDVVRGHATWRYENPGPDPLTALHFTLLANGGATPNPHLSNLANAAGHWNAWSPSSTAVEAVGDGAGAPLKWRYADGPANTQTWGNERGLLVVELPEPLAVGAAATVDIVFSTTVPHARGDQGAFNGDVTWRFGWFPQPRAREQSGAWSDAALLTAFTHRTAFEADREVVIGAQDHADGVWWSEVPVRSVPFVVSDRLETIEREIDGVQVRVHSYPDLALFDTSRGEARQMMDRTRRILPYLQKRYGKYRFRRLEVLESPTTQVSMAGDGMVLLGDLFFTYDRTWVAWKLWSRLAESVLAHEIAHQWWGLGLGVAFDHDNWLSEGLAQFLALSYTEERMAGLDLLDPNWFITWLTTNFVGIPLPERSLEHQLLPSYEDGLRFGVDEPLVLPASEVRHVEESARRLYEKGYLAARALRSLLGEKGTERVLRAVYERRAGHPVTVEDLRTVAQELEGVDLGPLLDGFVLGDAKADLRVVDVDGRRVSVRREGALALPAVVEVRLGHRRQRVDWPADAAELSFDARFAPDRVEIDPDAWVPDVDRSNNVWPSGGGFEWIAPQPDVTGHTWSFNPLPVHRRYLLGLSLGGRVVNELFWNVGAGSRLLGAKSEETADGEHRSRFVGNHIAYAETAWLYDRGRAVTMTAEGGGWQYGDALVHQEGRALLGHAWAVYERTDVGQLGALAIPRTVLTTAFGVDAGQQLTDDSGLDEVVVLEEGVAPVVVLGVLRNERVNYGFDVGLQLTGGLSRSAHDPFGVGVLTVGYGFVVPYLGRVELSGVGGALTEGGPAAQRPPLALLAATVTGTTPYELTGQAGAALRLPILRARRIKNLLTTHLLVFDDLSLDVAYAAAHGGTYDGGAGEPLGQVSAGLALGLGAFTGSLGDLVLGVAVPTWPGPTEPERWAFFLGLGFGALPGVAVTTAPDSMFP